MVKLMLWLSAALVVVRRIQERNSSGMSVWYSMPALISMVMSPPSCGTSNLFLLRISAFACFWVTVTIWVFPPAFTVRLVLRSAVSEEAEAVTVTVLFPLPEVASVVHQALSFVMVQPVLQVMVNSFSPPWASNKRSAVEISKVTSSGLTGSSGLSMPLSSLPQRIKRERDNAINRESNRFIAVTSLFSTSDSRKVG